MRLVLASASPRRAELLRAAGFAFDVQPADVDERAREGETPGAYATRVANAKADAVIPSAGNRIVLAADTIVVVDGLILGKPADGADAARMLRLLSGRRHQVLTAVTAVGPGRPGRPGAPDRIRLTCVESTGVEFLALSPDEIAGYVATGEPADKAGAYGVQGLASRFVVRIDGSYSNVVGLPVSRVYSMLHEIDPAVRPGYPDVDLKPESPYL